MLFGLSESFRRVSAPGMALFSLFALRLIEAPALAKDKAALTLERERIYLMMQDNRHSISEMEKALREYSESNSGFGKEEEEGTGVLLRKFEFMRMRANNSGYYRPVDVPRELSDYRAKTTHQSAPGYPWTELGPRTSAKVTGHWAPGIGRFDVINVNPGNPLEMLVGSPTGGLWKTNDEGKSWQCLNDHLPILGIAGIGIDWRSPDVIYIATGDKDWGTNNSIGVLKSTDGGSTWKQTGLKFEVSAGTTIRRMVMHPTNPEILLVGYSHGIYRTINGGTTWTEVLKTGWFDRVDDIEFRPSDPNTVYAVSYGSTASYFYKSTDGGGTFTRNASGLPTTSRLQIAVTEAAPDYVYFLSSSGVYRSVNSGASFSKIGPYPAENQALYAAMAFAVSHTNPDEVYVGEMEVYRSMNGGQGFTVMTNWMWPNTVGYTHCDIHELVFLGGVLYVGSDGLVTKSLDKGENWINMTEGIGNRQFRKLAVSKTSGNVIVLGSQDQGTTVYTRGEWHEWLGADGSDPVVDPTDENIIYGLTQSTQDVYKSTNGGYAGGNVSGIRSPEPNGGAFVSPMVIAGDNTIVLGAGELYRSKNGMVSWSKISAFGWGWNNGTGTNNRVSGLGICFSNSDYIYASETWSNHMRATSDGGSSWRDVTGGLPSQGITYIAVHPSKPQKVAVTLSQYVPGNKVFVTEDGGRTWSNISGTLPNLPATCAVWDGRNDDLYVGMDVGVYYRGGGMKDFTPFSAGLPNVIVSELEIHEGLRKIRAATFGRGLWEAQLYGAAGINTGKTLPARPPARGATIYSLQGKSLLSFDSDEDGGPAGLNALPLPPGIYFIHHAGNPAISRRVVLEGNGKPGVGK